MELVQVQITTTAVTSCYGTLVSGAILRTDPTFARHLVEDCNAAEYIDAQPAATDQALAVAQNPKAKAEAKAKKGGAA